MSCVMCSPISPAAGPQRSGRVPWLWRAMSIFTPRRAARRPGRWAMSRSAIRLAGLPGRLVRRRDRCGMPKGTLAKTVTHTCPGECHSL